MLSIPNNDQRKWRLRMLYLHGAILAGPLVLLSVPSHYHLNVPSICAFKAIFALDCPACGITRSALALFAGNINPALDLHPAGPVIVAILTSVVIYLVAVLFANLKGWEWKMEVRVYRGIEVLALTVLLIGWIGKLIAK